MQKTLPRVVKPGVASQGVVVYVLGILQRQKKHLLQKKFKKMTQISLTIVAVYLANPKAHERVEKRVSP